MRLVFAGSADFSVPVLRGLAASSHEVVEVVTVPDRPGSRGAAAPRPVKEVALELGLSVSQPTRLGAGIPLGSPADPAVEALVVAAYGELIPEAVLQSLPFGGLGVHPSLLPRHRGPSPVAASILAGDSRTGVTVFRMTQRMDAGPILSQEAIPVPASASSLDLSARLAQLGAQLLVRTLDRLEGEGISEIPQLESAATYTHLLGRRDGELDWSWSASDIDRRLRALAPWPGVTVPLQGTRVKLLRGGPGEEGGAAAALPGTILEQGSDWILVQTGGGPFRVEVIQPPGGTPMTPGAFLRGRQRGKGATSLG